MNVLRASCSIAAGLMVALGSVLSGTTLYVAPGGRDSWSGTVATATGNGRDGPLATLQGARDAVRRLKQRGPLTKPVSVLFREGIYPVPEPVVFEPLDSGTAAFPITYAAFPGEKPVFSGGRRLSGFRVLDGVWRLKLPGVAAGDWFFRSLFVNGRRAIRARTPNVGKYHHVVSKAPAVKDPATGEEKNRDRTAFVYSPGDIKAWRNFEDVHLVVYDAWATSILPIANLDERNRVVEFATEGIWSMMSWDTRYYVEHAPDALDAPGEWYLDREAGELLYRPLPGEKPETASVYAPVLEQMFLLRGDRKAKAYVEHVVFDGLSLQHTDWTANIAFARRAGAVTPYEITDRPVGYQGTQAAYPVPGAVQLTDTRHCAFRNCEITLVGNHAIALGDGCKDTTVERGHLHHLGGGGVKIGSAPTRTGEALAERNVVDNNFIHYAGRVYRAAVGVLILRSSHNRVSHNEISDLTYTGISAGWDWGYGASSAHHNIIEHNHIHRIGRGHLSDMGGVYTLGISPGTVIRYNLIHDLHCYKYGTTALYQDQASSEMLLENNISRNCQTGGYTLHYGRDNIVRNNIFALGVSHQISLGRPEDHHQLAFERNLIYYVDGNLTGHKWNKGTFTADRNLYWDAAGEPVKWGAQSLEQWREETKRDLGSVVADPQFANAEKGDFSIPPGSPAHKLGFVPIDMSKVGLYGDSQWTSLPSQAEVMPMEPTPDIASFADDYEGTPVGQLPGSFRVHGEIPGAGIRVTDRVAAAGKHSLEFVDSPEIKADYNPHMTFEQTRAKEGVLRATFDVRLEEGAMVTFEWRDWFGGPIKSGPSLSMKADGKLVVKGQELMTVPHGKWMNLDVVCGLGSKRTGTFSLTVTPSGDEPRRWDALPCGYRKFGKVNWIGIISAAQTDTRFQIDNFRLEKVDEE
ncbi:MAG: right-handed parallel beta-helix repeat-containing protein [Lentisphaerae bacterium]|nr:right-handed parallel beta-helix repeat-containing protein [Lentisphaerota bacterium]